MLWALLIRFISENAVPGLQLSSADPNDGEFGFNSEVHRSMSGVQAYSGAGI